MRNLALLRALLALTVGYAVVWALFVGRHVELDPLPHNVTRHGVSADFFALPAVLLGLSAEALHNRGPPCCEVCHLRAGSQYVSTGRKLLMPTTCVEKGGPRDCPDPCDSVFRGAPPDQGSSSDAPAAPGAEDDFDEDDFEDPWEQGGSDSCTDVQYAADAANPQGDEQDDDDAARQGAARRAHLRADPVEAGLA